jgi:hypothetical protein
MPGINLFRHGPDIEEHGPGTVLFQEGETGDEMFEVLDGRSIWFVATAG